MSHDGFNLCMQWMEQSCGAGRGREVEMASLPPKEGRSDLHVEAAWGAPLKLQSWLNANLREIAKTGEKGQGGSTSCEKEPVIRRG